MNYSTKGELRPAIIYALTHSLYRYPCATGAVVVRDTGDQQSDVYHERIARQSERFVRFARERSVIGEDALLRTALEACCATLHRQHPNLAVPAELEECRLHQGGLWTAVRTRISPGAELRFQETRDSIRVLHGDNPLGIVPRADEPWLRSLLRFGAGVELVRITGDEADYTLSVEVILTHVGSAIRKLDHALGRDEMGQPIHAGAGDGGGLPVPEISRLFVSADGPGGTGSHGGDGAPDNGTDNKEETPFRFWRDERGNACHNVRRASYYSRGLEWGYAGAGPAETALSVLLHFLKRHEAMELHGAYKDDVISQMKWEGGTITRNSVRQWIERERKARDPFA